MDHNSAVSAQIAAFAHKERLPTSFVDLALTWYWPLCQSLARQSLQGDIQVIGISGTQGSGKSTLAALLQSLLRDQFQRQTVCLSLDDFYLTRSERRHLANTVHPLFITRGVPGTHDITLASATTQALLSSVGEVKIPRFDKASDDRYPQSQWDVVNTPIDLVIFEGWCLGVPPQTEADINNPINDLEALEDPDCIWREAVNTALTYYQTLFQLVDYLVYLQSPNFAAVKRWRGRQEEKLAQATSAKNNSRVMDEAALLRFLQHYQRLTLHGFKTLPNIATTVLKLNEDQQITERINHNQHDQRPTHR